ncbi:hypothetical protein D3C85_771580 [compost metagenome]
MKIVRRVGGLEDLLAEDPRRLLGHAVPPQFRYGLLALEVASGVPEHRAVLAIRPALQPFAAHAGTLGVRQHSCALATRVEAYLVGEQGQQRPAFRRDLVHGVFFSGDFSVFEVAVGQCPVGGQGVLPDKRGLLVRHVQMIHELAGCVEAVPLKAAKHYRRLV